MAPRDSTQTTNNNNNNNDADDRGGRAIVPRQTNSELVVTTATHPPSRGAGGNAGDGTTADGGEPLAAFSSGAVSTRNGILTLSWGLDAVSTSSEQNETPRRNKTTTIFLHSSRSGMAELFYPHSHSANHAH
jgi:hypothetical protein